MVTNFNVANWHSKITLIIRCAMDAVKKSHYYEFAKLTTAYGIICTVNDTLIWWLKTPYSYAVYCITVHSESLSKISGLAGTQGASSTIFSRRGVCIN